MEPPDTPLARLLVVRTRVPTTLEVEIDDGDHATRVAWPGAREEHEVPLLGMGPDREVNVTVWVTGDRGPELRRLAPFRTAPLPAWFPDVDVLSLDAQAVEPGWRLLGMETPGDGSSFWTVALRASDGEVGWIYTGDVRFQDVRITSAGTLVGGFAGAIELDLLGRRLRHWQPIGGPDSQAIDLPWRGALSHEVHPLDDGSFLSLAAAPFDSPAWPTSYGDPTPRDPARIRQDVVVRFAADGSELAAWPLAERLDPTRIGFDSLAVQDLGFDWSHANAVIPWGGDGAVLVSSRHQDVLLKLDADGDLDWLIGDPTGWRADLADRFLAPEPGTTWSYHQHGPDRDGEGRILVFDNHNHGYTPYGDPPEAPPITSRVVRYVVDEAARTVRSDWSFVPPELLFSEAVGDARWLPVTGNVLACFGYLAAEGGIRNEDRGRGIRSARVVEVRPGDGRVVSDLRLSTPASELPTGIKVYRAVLAPTLYAAEVTVEEE